MANKDYKIKPTPESIDRIWELAEKMRTCMLVTMDINQPAARPMSAHVKREEHAVYFLDAAGSGKEQQLAANPAAMLAFADNGSNKFVTLRGRAAVSNDRALIAALWSDLYKAWWDSENDPEIRVITFTPDEGEIWDGLNNILASGAMLMSAITGAKPNLGETAKVDL
jgi:general stress protein 26